MSFKKDFNEELNSVTAIVDQKIKQELHWSVRPIGDAEALAKYRADRILLEEIIAKEQAVRYATRHANALAILMGESAPTLTEAEKAEIAYRRWGDARKPIHKTQQQKDAERKEQIDRTVEYAKQSEKYAAENQVSHIFAAKESTPPKPVLTRVKDYIFNAFNTLWKNAFDN